MSDHPLWIPRKSMRPNVSTLVAAMTLAETNQRVNFVCESDAEAKRFAKQVSEAIAEWREILHGKGKGRKK